MSNNKNTDKTRISSTAKYRNWLIFLVRNVDPFGHIILIPSQPVFALSFLCCVLGGEAINANFMNLWYDAIGARTREFTALETNTLATTLPIRRLFQQRIFFFLMNMLFLILVALLCHTGKPV